MVQVVNNPNESLIQSTTTADVDIGRSSSMLKDANTYFVSSVTSSSDDADIQTPQSSTSLALTAMPSESNFISAGEVGIAMPPAEQIQGKTLPRVDLHIHYVLKIYKAACQVEKIAFSRKNLGYITDYYFCNA